MCVAAKFSNDEYAAFDVRDRGGKLAVNTVENRMAIAN